VLDVWIFNIRALFYCYLAHAKTKYLPFWNTNFGPMSYFCNQASPLLTPNYHHSVWTGGAVNTFWNEYVHVKMSNETWRARNDARLTKSDHSSKWAILGQVSWKYIAYPDGFILTSVQQFQLCPLDKVLCYLPFVCCV